MVGLRYNFNKQVLSKNKYDTNILGKDNYRNDITKSILVLIDMMQSGVGYDSINFVLDYIEFLEDTSENNINISNIKLYIDKLKLLQNQFKETSIGYTAIGNVLKYINYLENNRGENNGKI